MTSIVDRIRQMLRENSDPHTQTTGQKFFREKIKLYGVKTSLVTGISKTFYGEIGSMDKDEVFALCGELWKSGYMEESFIACNFSYRIRNTFRPGDFQIFEKWLHTYVSNWASCDTLCNHTIGTFLEMYPEYVAHLKKWAISENRWVKRAAAVSLIIPAKQGKFLGDIIEIADLLLTDGDDLVQKGYGWLLKAASQANEKQVFAYIMEHKAMMPRTALRYAIEKMPEILKRQAME